MLSGTGSVDLVIRIYVASVKTKTLFKYKIEHQ